MNLHIYRPICFFDIESTGINITKDRIIEISFLKLYPNNNKKEKTWLVNPGIPIPLKSTKIHGIQNSDVVNKPLFKTIAREIYEMIKKTDLIGYNSNRFDVPLLAEELLRAGFYFDLNDHKIIDVQVIFHKMEPRNLTAAYKYYCNKKIDKAHSSMNDVLATYEIFKMQLKKYDIKKDVESLNKFSTYKKIVDLAGFIGVDEAGDEIFTFGKYKGEKINEVFKKNPGYYGWIQNSDFPMYTKKIIKNINTKRKFKNKTISN